MNMTFSFHTREGTFSDFCAARFISDFLLWNAEHRRLR